jgi:hypothetical protein
VLCLIPYVCMLSPLPRQVRETKSLGANPSSSAFPKFRVGRLLHYRFRGLLSVYSRYGLQTRQVAYATLYTGGLGGFVTSTAAPIATGWSDPVPGRVFLSRCGSTPFHGAPKNLYYTKNPWNRDSEIAVGIPLTRYPPRGPGRALVSASGSYRG